MFSVGDAVSHVSSESATGLVQLLSMWRKPEELCVIWYRTTVMSASASVGVEVWPLQAAARLCLMLAVWPSESRVVTKEPGRVLHGVKETISLVLLEQFWCFFKLSITRQKIHPGSDLSPRVVMRTLLICAVLNQELSSRSSFSPVCINRTQNWFCSPVLNIIWLQFLTDINAAVFLKWVWSCTWTSELISADIWL